MTTTTSQAMRPSSGSPEAISLGEYRLGPLTAIPPGEGRQFAVAGRDIAVFHARNGAVYATQAFCPHQAGPLADGLLGGTILVCPFHAWRFDLATGQPLMGQCGVQTYPVRLTDNGEIVLRLPSETPDFDSDGSAA